jgi:hypothetical protein
MARANVRLFVIGFVALAIGLAPVVLRSSKDIHYGWFILYTYPLVLGGVGLMVFAGMRSVLAILGVDRVRATILAGVAMIVQYFIVSAFQTGFILNALSFGVAFSGFAACLVVIIPMLRKLSAASPRDH